MSSKFEKHNDTPHLSDLVHPRMSVEQFSETVFQLLSEEEKSSFIGEDGSIDNLLPASLMCSSLFESQPGVFTEDAYQAVIQGSLELESISPEQMTSIVEIGSRLGVFSKTEDGLQITDKVLHATLKLILGEFEKYSNDKEIPRKARADQKFLYLDNRRYY